MAGVTRSKSDFFLIGQSSDDITGSGQGKLPLTQDVMKYLLHIKNLPENIRNPVKNVIICPLKKGKKDSICSEGLGCCLDDSETKNKCVIAKLKNEGHWTESGLPIITDYAIYLKVEKLFKEYQSLLKNKSRQTPVEIQKRDLYREKLNSLFDILSKDGEDNIKHDKCRSMEAKSEDLKFYEDQRGKRLMVIGARDTGYDRAIERKMTKEAKLNEPR